jgi:YrbI family 3-deoxy-D-manno-octulosonate 8-phosphate phosphatase
MSSYEMRTNNFVPDKLLLEQIIRKIRLVAFDFDGVFTNNMVYVHQNGSEAVMCFRGDGIGLKKLEQAGIKTVIISTEKNHVVLTRSLKLGIQCKHGCEDKRATLEAIVKEMGLTLEQVAFVGNDINDLSCLTCVGLPIVVQDAHADVIPYARYQTKAKGGHGAVREICDLFERIFMSKNLS